MNAIEKHLIELDNQNYQWAKRHVAAWRAPYAVEHGSAEAGLHDLIVGLSAYGEAHRRRHGLSIAEDSFLGPRFRQIALSILALLNGELGRFDGGSLDGLVRAIASENGVELE